MSAKFFRADRRRKRLRLRALAGPAGANRPQKLILVAVRCCVEQSFGLSWKMGEPGPAACGGDAEGYHNLINHRFHL